MTVVEHDLDPVVLVAEAASVYKPDPERVARVQAESASCLEHLIYAYLHAAPTPDLATAELMEWEHTVVEGHWTQPWNKARCAIAPIPDITARDAPALLRPGLAFAAVRREDMVTRGDYDAYMARILPVERIPEAYRPDKGWLVVPVHPFQVPNIYEKFPNAVVLDGLRVDALAQTSLRTLYPADQEPRTVALPRGAGPARETLSVKMPIGITVSSALRTVTPKTCHNGVGLHAIVARLEQRVPDHKLLFWPEVASAWPRDMDEQIAKHITSVIRTELVPAGERILIATALNDVDPATGASRCAVAFKLDTPQLREQFLTIYAHELFGAFLPSVLDAGFAFEAHMQNVLLRVRPARAPGAGDIAPGWEFAGFVIRDSGGVRVHPETLRAKTGMELDLLPGAVAMNSTKSMSTVYKLANHTLVQCHLHPLIRALDLHRSSTGWRIVRAAFRAHCPADTELYDLWMRRGWVSMKSQLRMKFDAMYYDAREESAPNVMLYRGEEWVRENAWWGAGDVVEEFDE
ncbi:hypothetical protein BOTBODRAFT_58083 [Botryobasidium botryosum FD-172 SS1]|uniref:Aerobactin siderophore biosynthesis IucA/IucC N-terminal domain-containing protein n=1 Tax=Botryobasidium botryosum (strain FD-172 SS1) TaxID=930990 RepID=A0A067M494_BOTB1|nr:hypothetical protein BOTBODRAFT_58083 [Botryobasidium botryosum FD-172 SS1]